MKVYSFHSGDVFGRDFKLVADDGTTIEGILEVTIRGYPNEPVRAEITLPADNINITVLVTEVNFVCPNCGDTVSHECGPQTIGGT